MIYQKARELGYLITESDYKKTLEEAQKIFNSNFELKEKFEDYTSYKSQTLKRIKMKQITEDELQKTKAELDIMSKELEDEDDLIFLLNAEKDFNNFVNKIMSILKSQIKGEQGCSGAACGGCAKG